MYKLTGKKVVITGGTKGIGLALADRLRTLGNTVIVLARGVEDDGVTAFKCDVTDKAQAEETFDRISAVHGNIDMLINNAGMGISGALELATEEELRRLMDLNLFGVIFCSQAALKHMDGGARIVNISSASAYLPMPYRTLYSVSKSAVNMLSFGLSMELKHTGIAAGTVCLGDIQTDFMEHKITNVATNERYGDRIANADNYAMARHKRGVKMAPEKVAKLIAGHISANRLRCLDVIGFKYRMLYLVQRVLPVSWSMNIVSKVFGKTPKVKN